MAERVTEEKRIRMEKVGVRASVWGGVRGRLVGMAAVLMALSFPVDSAAQDAAPAAPAVAPGTAVAAAAAEPALETAVGGVRLELAALLVCGFLLGAFLVNRITPQRRKLIRRAMLLLGAWLVGSAVFMGLQGTSLAPHVRPLLVASELMGALAGATVVVMLVGPVVAWARPQMPSMVMELLAAGGYVLAIMLVLRNAGVETAGLVTTSAILTGVLALSLQATLGNVLGGVALQLDESIRVGDWVELRVPERIQGRVRQIGWRHTVVETRNWDTLIVPNSNLLQANFLILGRREGQPLQTRRWVYFSVDLRHSPEHVIRTVLAALQAPLDNVAREPGPQCLLMDVAAPGRDHHGLYAARYWLTDLGRDDPTDSVVRARIHAALQRENIPFALTRAHLDVEQDDEEARSHRQLEKLQRRLAAVATVDLFKSLTEAERTELATSLLRTPFASGEVITWQGSVAHHLYVMTRGSAEVRISVDGSDKVVATLNAPTFFGEMGLMTGDPRSATVVATSEVETYRLDKASFHRILMARPEVAAEVSHILAVRKSQQQSVREAGGDKTSIQEEGRRMLGRIRLFFGLDSA